MTRVEQKQKHSVVSLFSGALGLDLGLERSGNFETLACVENQHAFCQTIRRNADAGRTANRKLVVYERDIRGLDPSAVMADLALEPGEVDVITGGPPCQAFSTAGRRGTVADPRGTLLWEFLRFIKTMRPKMFLMENVRGLMSAAIRHRPIADRPENGGPPLEPDELPGSVIRFFLRDLDDEYRLDCFEVNAVNYGVPQLRERVLFFGNRFGRLVDFPRPTHGNLPQDVRGWRLTGDGALHPYRTLRDALSGLEEETPVAMDFSPRKKHYLAMIPPGGNWRSLPPEVARESMGRAYFAKGGRSGWWRRLTLDLPSPTIVTMPNHAGTALCHPTEVRALTLRECARVQTFPDEWEFYGTPAEQYAQVGNGVPVVLGELCGSVLARELEAIYDSGFRVDAERHPICRVVYLKSHVRTRYWYKDGSAFVWRDGEENGHAKYGPMRTLMKVRHVRK